MCDYKSFVVLCWSFISCFQLAASNDLYWTTHDSITKITGLPSSPSQIQIHSGTTDSHIIGLGVDISDGLLFWTDLSSSNTEKGIWKYNFNGGNKQRILSGSGVVGLEQPTGLAVDWVNKIIYWTDPEQRTVEICDYNGKKRLTLITHGLSHPRGIVSDPINGFLYIGDQDLHQILRCKLNGKECSVWISTKNSTCSFWPNQLAINYINGRLYWADGWTSEICSCKLDGTNCNTQNITAGRDTNVFGIGLMASGTDTVIYYSGLHNSSISVLDSSRNSVFSSTLTRRSYFMVSTDKAIAQINGTSPCSTARCSDICVPRDQSNFNCACPSYSKKVMIDQENCGTPDEILLYADTLAGEVGMISANLKPIENVLHRTTLIARAENPVAVTFDSLKNDVYFSDIGSSTIEKVKLDGTNRMDLLNNLEGIDQVEGLAIDTKQGRLYFSNHGYTDNGSVAFWHKIEMISLDKSQRRTIITDVEKPRGIWIDSSQRHLYYTDWGSSPKVRRSTLDGLEIKEVTQSITHQRPNGIAVINNRTFFVDSDSQFIEFLNPGGTTKGQHYPPSPLIFPFGVTGNADSLYISDAGDTARINSSLQFIPINNPNGSIAIFGFQRLTGIHFLKMSSKYPQDLGVCSDSQNPCTTGSICVTRSMKEKATCLCQSDKLNYLATDRKTCKKPKNYMLIADVDGLKMASLESRDDQHVYTLRPGTGECGHLKGLTLDPSRNMIYYTGSESGKIYRAKIDGTDEKELMEHEHRIGHISYNNDNLFWTSLYGCNDTIGGVYQWNLDPQSEPIQIKENISYPYAIAANARYVYWSDETGINAYELIKKKKISNLIPDGNSGRFSVSSLSLDDLGTLYVSYSNGTLVARKFPTEVFRQQLVIDEGKLMPSEGMFVSGKYVYMVTSSNEIKLFDRLTKLNQTKQINTGSLAMPGQIVVIQDSNDQSQQQQELIKPGDCSSSVTGNCGTYDCNSDSVCGGNQKCCYSTTAGCSASVCENPIINSSDVCQLNIEGKLLIWSTQKGKYSDGCRECDCIKTTCKLVCPVLTCPLADQVIGGCCNVCSSIQKCSVKPTISNCPQNQINVLLPADKSYIVLDQQKLNIENISAQSCDFQPVKLSPLMPNNVTWMQSQQKIQITATDKQGTDICEFQLKVNDNTSPVITYCPESVEGIATSEEGLKVEWQEPKATDNSGYVEIKYSDTSRRNGEKFPIGADLVQYTATDGAGNKNTTCEFTVNIKKEEITCAEPPIVQNGVLICDSSSGKTVCYIQKCNKGYVLLPEHNKTYECSSDGVWKPAFPPLFKLEACFKPEPVEVKLSFTIVLINCPNAKFNKYDLINCLSISNVCPAHNSQISLCSGDRLTVTAPGDGSVTVSGDTVGEFRFDGDLNIVVSNILQANWRVVDFFKNKTYEMLCPKIACNIDANKTKSSSEVQQGCPVGSQLHKNVNGKPACVQCSPGKYYNAPVCSKCPAGKYQEEPGQLKCESCESGTTSKEAAYRKAHCVKIASSLTEDGLNAGPIVGIVVAILLVIFIVIAVVFICFWKRKKETIGKGVYEDSSKEKRVSDFYNELNEDEYNVIPADHVPTELDAGNDGYTSPNDMPNAGNDGYTTPSDIDNAGNDGYTTTKDMSNTENDGYLKAKDVSSYNDRALPNPYAQLGNKVGDKEYDGLLAFSSPYEKLQINKEKEETYTNPVYTGNIN